jgi:hypothetical protein
MKSGTYLYADSISKTYPEKRRKVEIYYLEIVELQRSRFSSALGVAFGVFISVGGFHQRWGFSGRAIWTDPLTPF